MSYDLEKDLPQDTRAFIKSEYGGYVIQTLHEMAEGYLSAARDISADFPERYVAKYSAIKEVIELIQQPILDDDIHPRG